jgi:hypothetical protein
MGPSHPDSPEPRLLLPIHSLYVCVCMLAPVLIQACVYPRAFEFYPLYTSLSVYDTLLGILLNLYTTWGVTCEF